MPKTADDYGINAMHIAYNGMIERHANKRDCKEVEKTSSIDHVRDNQRSMLTTIES